MRLWHQKLIPYLDRQRLLGQHRECAALRGAGWGRPHATVNYVFTHHPTYLVVYHTLIMQEMERRGYNPDPTWKNINYRGKTLGEALNWADPKAFPGLLYTAQLENHMIYPEHNDTYLQECIQLLKDKNAPINWEEVPDEL